MNSRLLFILLCALVAFGNALVAGPYLNTRELGIADIPSCGVCYESRAIYTLTDSLVACLHGLSNPLE